jgi:hypothetical protein
MGNNYYYKGILGKAYCDGIGTVMKPIAVISAVLALALM